MMLIRIKNKKFNTQTPCMCPANSDVIIDDVEISRLRITWWKHRETCKHKHVSPWRFHHHAKIKFVLDSFPKIMAGPYACNECEKTFSSRYSRNRHQNLVHHYKVLFCPHCMKIFSRQDTFFFYIFFGCTVRRKRPKRVPKITGNSRNFHWHPVKVTSRSKIRTNCLYVITQTNGISLLLTFLTTSIHV